MNKRIFRRLVSVALVGIVSLVVGTPVAAQGEGPTDDEVNAIARELYCPVCENVPLDVCPTQACEQWRATIREQLAQGWSEEQIKQYFVQQYGARVLATPPAQGLNWLVYVLPPVAFLAGAWVLARALRSWRAAAAQPIEAHAPSEDPYIARVEEELRRMERGDDV